MQKHMLTFYDEAGRALNNDPSPHQLANPAGLLAKGAEMMQYADFLA